MATQRKKSFDSTKGPLAGGGTNVQLIKRHALFIEQIDRRIERFFINYDNYSVRSTKDLFRHP